MGTRISRVRNVATFASPQDMQRWAGRFAKSLRPGNVVSLVGPLGAGKTTFVQGVARALGYRGDVTSPTFALANEYRARGVNVYHMDMYRLSPAELDGFPLEDYYRGGICLIEWADRVRSRLPPDVWEVNLTVTSPSVRRLEYHRVVAPRTAQPRRFAH